jgi:protein O-GlcNAc transferase
MSENAAPILADAQAAVTRGDFAEAERLLHEHLSDRQADLGAWVLLGNVQVKRGDTHAGLASYDHAVALDPADARLWYQRGILLHSLRQWDAALESYGRAAQIVPKFPRALAGKASILLVLGRLAEALDTYQHGLALSPSHPGLLLGEALLLARLERFAEALISFEKLSQIDPGNRDARNGVAISLQKLGRLGEALSIFDEMVAQNPDMAYLQYNRGTLLNDLHDYAGALDCFDKAIAIQPDIAEAHNNRGHALRKLHHLPEALAAHDRALSLNPNDSHFLHNRSLVLLEMGAAEQALTDLETALSRASENPEFLYTKATALEVLSRFSGALPIYDRVLELDPKHPYAFGGMANAALCACDWRRQEAISQDLATRTRTGRDVIPPFTLLGYGVSEAEQLAATKRYLEGRQDRPATIPARTVKCTEKPRLRLGYVSADYHEHATTYLLTGLIENHDRNKFDVHGISTGPKARSKEAERLRAAFDAFHDVRFQSDDEIAGLIRSFEIDILIDLKGYTQDARPGIFACRAAPVQIAWLGYPATAGSVDLDYLIADRFVLPAASEEYYTEKIIRLPTCYQANDNKREIATEPISRTDFGLPENAFVFCCFNNSRKITRPVFEVWMRLLTAVEGSVLWLLDDNKTARDNLVSAAEDNGVRPDRLSFAPCVPVASHLGRHRLADLFLDTVPYNAHTGAADALWAGLPLLTCTGHTFAGRVATSLLHAVDLPELITTNLAEYESRALELAKNRGLLETLRNRLREARKGPGLFDTRRFTSEMEAAYREIWQAHSS